jgi:hypothetical protein
MIESHRLMPLAPGHAIAGYVIGAGAPAVIAFAGLYVVGGTTATAAGVNAARWTFACVVLLGFALFIFISTIFAAFTAKMGAAFVFVPMVGLWITQGGFLSLLPGVTVVLSPIMGQSVFDLRGAGFVLPATYAISFAAQGFFSTIFYIAAARKYRRADAIGVDSILALCLLATWVGVSWAGMRAWEDFKPRGWSMVNATPTIQILSSMISALLLAICCIAANARERNRWKWHQRVKDPAALRKPLPIWVVIPIATALIVTLPLAPAGAEHLHADAFLRAAIAIALTLTGLHFLIECSYGLRLRAAYPIFLWVIFIWLAPILVDLIRFALADYGEAERVAGFSTISPVGTIVLLWMRSPITTTPGLVIQAGIVAIVIIVWRSMREPRRVALPL